MAARKKRKKKRTITRKTKTRKLKPLSTRGLGKFKGRRKTKRRRPRVSTEVSGNTARSHSRYRGGR